MSDDDFRATRNKRRRVYGYERNPRDPFEVVAGGVTRSFDRNSIVIHHDFYLLRDPNGAPPGAAVFGEYDEDYVVFAGQDSLSKAFNVTFSAVPTITMIVETSDGDENLIPTVLSLTSASFTVGLSAEFSGNIRYMAINHTSYPVIVRRSPLEPTLYYTASVVTASLSASVTSLTASFPALGGPPTAIFYSIFDSQALNDSCLGVVSGSYTSDSTPVELSDSSSGATIMFMAVK